MKFSRKTKVPGRSADKESSFRAEYEFAVMQLTANDIVWRMPSK
jgi:hypothetical protein